MSTPRVRFAPAPSGWLHVGSVRTALFNWLYARHHGGAFLFRIEDTDAARATGESMQSMLDAMRWLGLDWDEGVEVGGPYGPYRQSERGALHRTVARRLEERGDLYRDYRTGGELDAWRAARREAGEPPIVKRSSGEASAADRERFEAEGRPSTLRLGLPEGGAVTVDDLVRGEVTWEWAHESDPVLVRSDGTPTYLLANAVDDVAQGVTLVCRGEDLLSAVPRQLRLYDLLLAEGLLDRALDEVGLPAREGGWVRPNAFAHLSMIVGMDRKKLSKRHGSVAIQEFARQGYLPEALLNYIALLGWAPRDGRERMDVDDIVAAFSFDTVGRSAAAFDVDKLTAFNGERIRELDGDDLAERLVPYLDGTHGAPLVASPPTDEERRVIRALVPIIRERMQRLDEVTQYAPAFLRRDLDYDQKAVAKVLRKAGAVGALEAGRRVLAEVAWDAQAIEAALRPLAGELGIGFGKVAQPIRVAVTGSSVSPPLFESLEILPREWVLERLDAAIPMAQEQQAAAS